MGTQQEKFQERFSTSNATSTRTVACLSGFTLSGFIFYFIYILCLCCVFNGRGWQTAL